MNPNNFATIDFEVATVHHLEWLQSRVEARKGDENVVLSLMAIDSRNRKFTNCTNLDIEYKIGGIAFQPGKKLEIGWKGIGKYAKDNLETVLLKDRFLKEPELKYESQLA